MSYTHPKQAATVTVAASDALHPERADYKCTGTNDQVDIQAANEAANGGIVQLIGRTFNVTTLMIDKCTLRGEGPKNTTINATGLITVKRYPTSLYGRLQNVKIVTSNDPGVLVDGGINVLPAYDTLADIPDLLDNIEISRAAMNQVGTGLLIKAYTYASGQSSSIAHCTFGKIVLKYWDYGMIIYADGYAGTNAYVNSNTFRDIVVMTCHTHIKLDSPNGREIAGNDFLSIHLQWATGSQKGLVFTGGSHYNRVHGFMAFDWVVGNDYLTLDADCGQNLFIGFFDQRFLDIANPFNTLINQKTNSIYNPHQTQRNLLTNGDFEVGLTPVGWAASGSTISYSSGHVLGNRSLKITSNGAQAHARQTYPISYLDHLTDQYLTLGAWCKAPSTNTLTSSIAIKDSTGAITHSKDLPKDTVWHWTTVTHIAPSSFTYIGAWLYVNNTATTDTDDVLYVDGAILVQGGTVSAFVPNTDQTIVHKCVTTEWLSPFETGYVLHTNVGAAGAIEFDLPQSNVKTGCLFKFANIAGHALRVDPGAAGAIYINGAKQTDDKYIACSTVGACVDLVHLGSGDWIVCNIVGTWTVES